MVDGTCQQFKMCQQEHPQVQSKILLTPRGSTIITKLQTAWSADRLTLLLKPLYRKDDKICRPGKRGQEGTGL